MGQESIEIGLLPDKAELLTHPMTGLINGIRKDIQQDGLGLRIETEQGQIAIRQLSDRQVEDGQLPVESGINRIDLRENISLILFGKRGIFTRLYLPDQLFNPLGDSG